MSLSVAELLKGASLSRLHMRVSLRWRDLSCPGNGFISAIELLHYVILISAVTRGSYLVFNHLVVEARYLWSMVAAA